MDDDKVVQMAEWLRGRGEDLVREGKDQEAAKTFEQALQRGGDDPALLEACHSQLGDIYLRLRKLKRAKTHLDKAIELNPAHPHYHYLLGFVHSVNTEWLSAINEFEKALAVEPEKAEYLRGIGWAYFNAGEMHRGEELLRKGQKLDPDNPWIICDLAVCLMQVEQFDEAIALLEDAAARFPDSKLVLDTLAAASDFQESFRRVSSEDETAGMLMADETISPYRTVERLVREGLERRGCRPEAAVRAEDLWRAFVRSKQPRVANCGAWAAALEYAVVRKDLGLPVTQSQIAATYGTSIGSLSRRYRRLSKFLPD